MSQLRGPLAAASRAVLDAAPREPCTAPVLLRRMPAWAAATRLLLLPWARLHALADAELRAQGVALLLAWLGVHLVGVRLGDWDWGWAGYYTALTLASSYPYPYP